MTRGTCWLATAIVLSACYASHRPDGGGAADRPAPADEADEADEADGGGAGGASGNARGVDAAAGTEAGVTELWPFLQRAEPGDACINTPTWVALQGSGIHWEAAVRLRYPHSGAEVIVGPGDGLVLDWRDTSEVAVEIGPDLPWQPKPLEGHSLPSGHYLTSVINPGGRASNEVDVVLSWCD